MSDESRVAELIKTLTADPQLRERLAQTPPQDRAAIIEELGFGDVSAQDVAAHVKKHANPADFELDDSEMDAVAGGIGAPNPYVSDGAFIVA